MGDCSRSPFCIVEDNALSEREARDEETGTRYTRLKNHLTAQHSPHCYNTKCSYNTTKEAASPPLIMGLRKIYGDEIIMLLEPNAVARRAAPLEYLLAEEPI